MGVDFNAEFVKLNTNSQGSSANILDAEECKAANNSIWTVSEGMTAEQFKAANQHCSEYDTNKDGVVTVAEQKASIATELKNVWLSYIARFFKDNINYDDSKSNTAAQITRQVQARIQNCLDYIRYAKQNNIDIFYDNTDTGVDDKDGELQKFTDGNGETRTTRANPGVKDSKRNTDGTTTTTYKDGTTQTYNDNCLMLANTGKNKGSSRTWSSTYDYKEDGSYTDNITYSDGYKEHRAYDKNEKRVGAYIITARGNYKASAKAGESFEATLERLGISSKYFEAMRQANPKAAANKAFLTTEGDVYIPKEIIEDMKKNNTFDEQRLMSA